MRNEKIFCRKCGQEIKSPETKVCPRCGQKLNDNRILLWIVAVLIVLIMIILSGIGMSKDAKREEFKPPEKQEQQVEEPKEEVQEPEEEIKDEDLTPTLNTQSNVDRAYDALKPIIDDKLSNFRHELRKEDNTIFLIVHLDAEQVLYADQETWDSLVVSATNSCGEFKKVLNSSGCNDVSLSYMIGDLNRDKVYLTVLNGEVIYNAR